MDVIDRLLTQSSRGPLVRPFRDLSEFNSTVDFAIVFALDATVALIRYYCPSDEKEHSAWYSREIAPTKIPKLQIDYGTK